MAVNKINVPNIGKDPLEVTEILVKVGDNININQPLIIIEGDKTSVEIPSIYNGVVTKIYINIGDKVSTGTLVLLIDTNNHINTETTNHHKPFLHSNIDEFNILHKKNDLLHTKQVPNTSGHAIAYDTNTTTIIHATPLIRHMARTLGIDLSQIKGTGRKGRILKEDIQNYLNSLSIKYANPEVLIPSNQLDFKNNLKHEINYNVSNETTIIPLNKIQKTSGINLQKNWATIPHVTQFDSVDITNLESFRKQQNSNIETKQMNYKITILIFVMKAVAKVLEDLPRFNSVLSKDGNSLIIKKYINIGIAVNTKKGLFVPVIHNVNKKGIIKLSQELSEIIKKARSDNNQLTPHDMQGGSFTISNLGGIGGETFTPIINAPEVAILGISKSSIRPIWDGNKFIPRLMLPLSLSYDHRVIDGVYGAKFINLINKIISDIRLLSM